MHHNFVLLVLVKEKRTCLGLRPECSRSVKRQVTPGFHYF